MRFEGGLKDYASLDIFKSYKSRKWQVDYRLWMMDYFHPDSGEHDVVSQSSSVCWASWVFFCFLFFLARCSLWPGSVQQMPGSDNLCVKELARLLRAPGRNLTAKKKNKQKSHGLSQGEWKCDHTSAPKNLPWQTQNSPKEQDNAGQVQQHGDALFWKYRWKSEICHWSLRGRRVGCSCLNSWEKNIR